MGLRNRTGDLGQWGGNTEGIKKSGSSFTLG